MSPFLLQPIEVTGRHPIYSQDRLEFVQVRDLQIGERLRARSGVAVVESVGRKWGTHQVYNLEVGRVHQYFVSELEVLAHNAGCGPSSRQLRNQWEAANGEPWPKDAAGRNQDVSHIIPKADGGPNSLENIEPMPHDEHMQMHSTNGDFRRWGARANGGTL